VRFKSGPMLADSCQRTAGRLLRAVQITVNVAPSAASQPTVATRPLPQTQGAKGRLLLRHRKHPTVVRQPFLRAFCRWPSAL